MNKIEWAGSRMPVLKSIKLNLKGLKIGACLHVTAETANLVIALKQAGAKVWLCGSNPLSTQDDVATYLNTLFPVYAKRGESKKEYNDNLKSVLKHKPDILMDDGADLIALNDNKVIGATEETTTGVIRLKAMEKDGKLSHPVIAVNESKTKHLFDNRYGTGQSTVDGILRATNMLLSGKQAIVVGYGWCGRGIAMRLKGMGAIVTVVEIDPVKALEASMDGYYVTKIENVLKYGELYITATGDKNVIPLSEILKMKDGVILGNSGHFNVEFDYEGLLVFTKTKKKIRDNLEKLNLKNGKIVYVIGEGRLVNLVAAEGHPADVMDLSFANQLYAVDYLTKHKLENKVNVLPKDIDDKVATKKLKSMNIDIGKLTKEQIKYLDSWENTQENKSIYVSKFW